MFTNLVIRFWLILLAVCSPALAYAQSSNEGDPSQPMWTNLNSISNFFSNFYFLTNADKTILGAALSIAPGLMTAALTLAGALALINILWVAIDHMVLKGHRDLMWPPIVYTVVMAVITAGLLNNYAYMAQNMVDFFLGVSNLASGADNTQQVATVGGQLVNLTISGMKAAFASVKASYIMSSGFVLTLIDILLSLIIGLFCIVLAMLMFVSIVSSLFTGTIMAGIAIALGPLFVATLASGFTKVFFDKWFGFFCSALFVKAVVMTMLALLVGILNGSLAATSPIASMNTGDITWGHMLTLAVTLWIMQQLMSQAPNIASAMMPGGLGVNVKGALGPAVAAAAGAVTGAVSTAYGTAQAVTQKADSSAGAMFGSAAGAAAGSSGDGGKAAFAKGVASFKGAGANAMKAITGENSSGGGSSKGKGGGGSPGGSFGGGSSSSGDGASGGSSGGSSQSGGASSSRGSDDPFRAV